ncbi:MAG: transposase family protein [Armatimonadetes bacterium]|nr:transposase family protein [Armatimonadota bacterium]
MTHQTKNEIIRHFRKPYVRASKAEKTRTLNNIIESTGYSRKHAITLLNGRHVSKKKIARLRPSRYAHLYKTLKFVWTASNFLCGKRLKPFLPELIKSLKRHKEIKLSKNDEALILAVSAATIDRLLAPARKGLVLKGRSTTKPGTLLKHQIPIRTFADWTEDKPGFLEIDLVAHCGDANRGEYINTLNMTDIATGWTVATAFMGRSERFCVDAINEVKPSLPFRILGIDSDNGSEFINAHLKRYCEREQITFTRSRPYKKNDSAHIEQKNWDVIRKMIGYGRFDTYEQLDIIKRIESLLAFYQNYFQPSQKLISKTRIGAKVTKKYDTAQTPVQRLLSRKDKPKYIAKHLNDTFRQLNPVALIRDINELVSQLYDTLIE